MVYRGRPSGGCEACRNAKKGCDLAIPCKRCAKRKIPCTGRRNTAELRIKDETKSVEVKVKGGPLSATSQSSPIGSSSVNSWGQKSPTRSSFSSETGRLFNWGSTALSAALCVSITTPDLSHNFRERMSDVATNYFLLKFTSAVDWECVRTYVKTCTLQPCLDLAIKACGMAAFDNTHNVPEGRAFATSLYTEAIRLVNAALRDPVSSQADQSLIAVVMLGYYEKLTCDGPQSMQMWRAHVDGATQILKLRGKEQFNSALGRLLFRDLRGGIVSNCFWRHTAPPEFLADWQDELESQTVVAQYGFADHLVDICLEFATLRSKIHFSTISDIKAAENIAHIDDRLIQWSIAALASDPCWRYSVIEIPDSLHVWNGRVHAYASPKAPQVWNWWRSVRIMVIHTWEMLHNRLHRKGLVHEKQTRYFRKVLQEMANDICAATPFALGRSATAFNSACVLMTASNVAWPLFFAGTCALDAEKRKRWHQQYFYGENLTDISDGAAQLEWIQEQFNYIYNDVGIRWVKAVATTLKRSSLENDNAMKLIMELDSVRVD